MKADHADVVGEIRDKGTISDELEEKIKSAIGQFMKTVA